MNESIEEECWIRKGEEGEYAREQGRGIQDIRGTEKKVQGKGMHNER